MRVDKTRKKYWTAIKLVYIGFALSVVAIHFKTNAYEAKWALDDTTPKEIHEVIDLIKANKEEGTVLLTDTPNLAFHAQVLIPPSLSTFSGKQYDIGNITDEGLAQIAHRKNVDMIAWYRFPDLGEKVMERLGASYGLVYENKENHLKLYFRRKQRIPRKIRR